MQTVFLSLIFLFSSAQRSQAAPVVGNKISSAKDLLNQPDEFGNKIPDYSFVGYHRSEKPLPNVEVTETLSPVESGDDTDRIQKVLDSMTPGALLLKTGTYRVATSLWIRRSGIVLRGETGTKIIATGDVNRTLINIGSADAKPPSKSAKLTDIVDEIAPVGATSVTVADSSAIKVGDLIGIVRPPSEAWIKTLGMDQKRFESGTWIPEDYTWTYERTVKEISGNKIIFEKPLYMSLEKEFGGGYIVKLEQQKLIEEIGVENLNLDSEFKPEKIDDHAWIAVEFHAVKNSWAADLNVTNFVHGILTNYDTRLVTIQDSRVTSPKSEPKGGRRYPFYLNGQGGLVQRCFSQEGRHDYVTSARVQGPNVFYDSDSVGALSDNGPHHRWSVGLLFDNIRTNFNINIQNRGQSGTGHGFTGAFNVLWNCAAKAAGVQSPPHATNWVFGLNGQKGNVMYPHFQYHEAQWAEAVKEIPSLFIHQLSARIDVDPTLNLARRQY